MACQRKVEDDNKSEGKFTKPYPYNFVTTHTVNTVQRMLFAGGGGANFRSFRSR